MAETTEIAGHAGAQPLHVLAASALRSSLTRCAEVYAKQAGAGFSIAWGTSGAIEKRIRGGEAFYLVAGAREMLGKLAADNLCSHTILDIGVSKLALGVRSDADAPDISSLSLFRAALQTARMISRGDPAGGGTAGNHLVKVFERMGVTDMVAAKSVLRAGGFAVMNEVVQGHADFGLTQSTEIPAVEGARIGAFLPAEVQLETIYAIAATAQAHEHAGPFLDFLNGDEARLIVTGAGFAPAP